MFARGKDMRGAVLILLVALSAMLAMPVHVAYADADGTGADGAGQGIQADADGKNPSEGESQDGQGSEVPGELGRPGMDGESPDGSSDPADPVKPADPADPPDGSGDAGGPEAPADGSAGPAPAEAPAGPAAPAPAEPPAPAAALPENDSPDGSAYRGATLRRTPLYASPDASQPEADFLWGGVVVGGFTRWDAAGEWLAVAYGGGRYFARASDVSLNDGSGSRVAVTLSRTPAYEAPDASLPEAEFFWGGVSLSASAWDAAGEWLAVPYRGATYFVRSDALSSADSPDGSAYRGATLRRTPLYASPDASQPEADFLWGGVVVGGFTRWDAAGEWLAVAYGGGRYFARASDVSLNDGSGSRVAVTLSRTPAYEAPDASLPEAEFFWGGVSLSASAWDAAGEWLAVPYRGATYFLRSEALSSADAADRGARLGVTLRRTDLYASPDDSQAPADFFWGGVVLSGFSRWDAAGGWLAVAYAGQTLFAKASDVSLADAPDRAAYRGVTLRRTDLYASPDDSQAPADFFWGGVVLSGFSRWDAAGGWLAVAYAGQTLFAKASDVSLNDAPGRDAPYVGRTLGRVSMYPAPDLSSEPFDFFWGGVEVPAAPWDAAGEWVLSSYRGQAAFLPADSVELVLADPMVRKAQDYTSITPYLILVDTAEHKVGVFSGSGNGGWRRIHFWDCADGAPATPTVKGSFTVGIRGYYFDSSNARCFYYTQFYGNYLFHSTLYYQYPTPSHPMDSRLGMALSHGCVRLQLDNAKWIYDNIPWGTKVVVY